jgi:hypothetical protein
VDKECDHPVGFIASVEMRVSLFCFLDVVVVLFPVTSFLKLSLLGNELTIIYPDIEAKKVRTHQFDERSARMQRRQQ